jgi:integrase
MARKRTRKGYSKRSRSEHPGVTISTERRGGQTVVALRWRDPAPQGRVGARRKLVLAGHDGLPLSSREAARPFAVAKSRELAKERQQLADGAKPVDRDATWLQLLEQHAKHLTAKDRSPKTLIGYRQCWPFLESWRGRPARPHDLTVGDLEGFVEHVRNQPNSRTGAALSPHSVAGIARHFKAMLNFGRRRLSCVRLDAEAINEGLSVGRVEVKPVTLTSANLRGILEAAATHDEERPDSELFPLLAFLMVTGCRRGEAERLRWKPSAPDAPESWVDFDGDRLLIYGAKTRRQRVVPLTSRPALRKMLQTMAGAADPKAEPYVFGGALPLAIGDKRHVLPDDDDDDDAETVVGRSLKAAIKAVQGATDFKWKPKDFRSTCATYLANSGLGLNLYVVAGELGHDYAVLVKHYAGHFALPRKQASAATVEELLGIKPALEGWISARTGRAGRLLKLKRA